jgi:hypothetical protein
MRQRKGDENKSKINKQKDVKEGEEEEKIRLNVGR